jgi:hypothetical protein
MPSRRLAAKATENTSIVRFDHAKERTRKSAGSTTGEGWVSERHQKTAPAARARARVPVV